MDKGQQETEKLIKEMEKRINKEYAQAEKEIEAQLQDYLRRFEIKDKKWQEWVEDGKKTEEEYKAWRTQQMAVGQKWEAQKNMIAEEMHHSNEIARQIVNDTTPQIYGTNHDWATWQVEHDASVNTGYTLYNKDAVARMLKDDPDMLPPPSQRTLDRIARNKETLWNKQQLQSVMMQGILQGDSIPKLATRLSNTVGERNRKAAIRNARTMATGAQNAGRNNAYKRAEKKGIDLEKVWLATMDNRTRHSHRWIDRETVPMDEDFSNGLEYPADPKGDPAEVYNCRCSMRAEVKGLERRSGKFRDDSAVEHMSYDEWRNAKPKSRDILHQDKVSEAMKRKHINEYRGRGGSTTGISTIPTTPKTPTVSQTLTGTKGYEEKTRQSLYDSYSNHMERNKLNLTPLSELDDPIKINYGKLSENTAQHFANTIDRLSKQYDSTLNSVRVMTKEEFFRLPNAFASVWHEYSVDKSEMLINPIKCSKYDRLTERLSELKEKHWIPNIKDGNEGDYVPTHEFAHTLLSMQDELDKKRNWAQVDQDRIKEIRNEIDSVYKDYLTDVKETEKAWKAAELKGLETFDESEWKKAAEFKERYDKIKISEYSLTNADEFMAESFALDKLGDNDNEYALRIMEIIDRYFKR